MKFYTITSVLALAASFVFADAGHDPTKPTLIKVTKPDGKSWPAALIPPLKDTYKPEGEWRPKRPDGTRAVPHIPEDPNKGKYPIHAPSSSGSEKKGSKRSAEPEPEAESDAGYDPKKPMLVKVTRPDGSSWPERLIPPPKETPKPVKSWKANAPSGDSSKGKTPAHLPSGSSSGSKKKKGTKRSAEPEPAAESDTETDADTGADTETETDADSDSETEAWPEL